MNNILTDSLINHKDLIFCYGNIISSLNKVICSARLLRNQLITRYDNEVTIISNVSQNILEINYSILFKHNTISHNFSITKINSVYIGIGGTSLPGYLNNGCLPVGSGFGNYNEGLYLMKSNNCDLWTYPIKIIDRDWGLKNECCCFDSQSSLVFDTSSNIYYLYCRWNPDKQVRKLQVFTTNNIDNWSNNSIEIIVDININIYTANVFKYKDKFVAVVRYYIDREKWQKEYSKVGILQSNNGTNFCFIKDIQENYAYYTHGDITQGYIIENEKLYIYLLCQSGKLNKYEITI